MRRGGRNKGKKQKKPLDLSFLPPPVFPLIRNPNYRAFSLQPMATILTLPSVPRSRSYRWMRRGTRNKGKRKEEGVYLNLTFLVQAIVRSYHSYQKSYLYRLLPPTYVDITILLQCQGPKATGGRGERENIRGKVGRRTTPPD